MKIIVLGGTGFIGTNLVRKLAEENHDIVCFGSRSIIPRELRYFKNINFKSGNFKNFDQVEAAAEGCEVAYHLISSTTPQKASEDPYFDIENNLLPSIKFIYSSKKLGIKKIIFASSGGTIYGNSRELPTPESAPTNPLCAYGITKLAIEKHLAINYRENGVSFLSLRISNPFGPGQQLNKGQGVIGIFIHKIINGIPIEIWGDGTNLRDYIFIEDLIDIILLAINPTDFEDKIINISSGIGTSLNQIIHIIEEVSDLKSNTIYLQPRALDVTNSVLSNTLAKRIFNWEPKYSIKDGIRLILNTKNPDLT